MKIFPTVNISKLNFWLLICIAKNFIWTTLKIFSIFRFFFAPSDSRFTNIVRTIHQWTYYVFSFQMMHKSQFKKMDPYDWFCAPVTYYSSERKVKMMWWLLKSKFLEKNGKKLRMIRKLSDFLSFYNCDKKVIMICIHLFNVFNALP